MIRSLEELQKRYSYGGSGKSGNVGPGRGGPGRGGPGRRRPPEEKQKTSKGAILRLLSYLSAYKYKFVVVFFCLMLSTTSGLLASYMLSPILDKVAEENPPVVQYANGKLSVSSTVLMKDVSLYLE